MPLTAKGQHVMNNMIQTYGSEEKAKEVFYSMKNAGKLTGVDEAADASEDLGGDFAAKLDAAVSKAEQLDNRGTVIFGRLDSLIARHSREDNNLPPSNHAYAKADESFDKLENQLAHKKGVHDPTALAAWIGREHGKIK